MEILFTGATGVLGRAALPRLVAEGHRVSAAFRSDADAVWLEEVGARPTELDLFDAGAVEAAVRGVDTVVHYATAIPRLVDMSNRESWVVNDRLRDTATGLLVDAALANEVERFVQQSITFIYADGGEAWLDETSPLGSVVGRPRISAERRGSCRSVPARRRRGDRPPAIACLWARESVG
jgi:nucleoside-diphosphate-sugar epimerase